MNHLRNLRPDEIATLRSQACRADDWNQVWVPEVFDIEYVNHVRFSGVVKLGAFRKIFTLPGGLVKILRKAPNLTTPEKRTWFTYSISNTSGTQT